MGVMDIRRKILLAQDQFVPPGYQKVEYLETVGTASIIDTGVAGNDNTIQIDFEWMPLAKGGYSRVLGNHDGEAKTCWRILMGPTDRPNSITFTLNNRKASSSSTINVSSIDTIVMHKFIIHMEYGTGYVEYDGIKYYANPVEDSAEQSNLNIVIGTNGPNATGSATAPSNRFYWVQIRK